MNNSIKLRVCIDVTYPGDGDGVESIQEQLRQGINRCIQRENLLGADAESISFTVLSGLECETPLALTDLLERAESFIGGFEDDDNQEGVTALLAGLRGRIAQADPNLIEQVKDGITYAQGVVENWESGDLAGAVNELGFWLEKNDTGSFNQSHPLFDILTEGLVQARCVEANWEQGDLAGAVHALSGWIITTRTTLCEMGLLNPIAVVEVSGGLVQNITGAGACSVLVVDYDNGEDDDSLPHIPSYDLTSYGDQASVAHWVVSGSQHRAWCEAVGALPEHE